jgi:hypothetical protein
MSGMSILRSPRWRRRLVPVALVLATAAPLIVLGVHFSNPGDPRNANGPEVAGGAAYVQPKKAPFTKASQRQVHGVLRDFIATAVVRHDPGRSWSLTAPSLRAGFTRKQWNRGDLPVVPYPAKNKGWGTWNFVQYSYEGTVGLEVFLFPKPGSGWSAMTADVELVKGHDGNWRVDYWMPKKFHGPPAVAAKTKAKVARSVKRAKATTKPRAATPRRQAAPLETGEPSKPSAIWWALPIGILALIVLTPLGIGIGGWVRDRRAEREYLRSSGRT